MHVIVVVIVVVYDVSTEHVASSIFLLVCQVVCDLFFLHVCQILCFTISSNLVLPIFVFCLFSGSAFGSANEDFAKHHASSTHVE